MKILIVEDEKPIADKLEELITEIEPQTVIVNKLISVNETINWLKNNTVDLIFLDINLADGNSFQIFEQITVTTPIIFTTAYDQYAIRAFEVNSIDYLLKPLNKELLKKAIAKFENIFPSKTDNTIEIERMLKSINSKEIDYQKRFIFYLANKIDYINTEDIACFTIIERNVFIISFNNKTYSVDYSLDKIENLVDPQMFFRINRRYIVNIKAIKNMYPLSNSRLKLELKIDIKDETIVSLHRYSKFKKWLNK